MAKLPFPDVPPGPLRELLEELHKLHARAGWPSVRELARGQNFSHTAVHELFTKSTGDRKLPVLLNVVEKLAELAPRLDLEAALDRFDQLWEATAGRTGIEKQGNPLPSRTEQDEAEQYTVQRQRFATELKNLVNQNTQGLSISEFCAQARISHMRLWEALEGRRIPRGGELRHLLGALNVSREDIARLMTEAYLLIDWEPPLDAEPPGQP